MRIYWIWLLENCDQDMCIVWLSRAQTKPRLLLNYCKHISGMSILCYLLIISQHTVCATSLDLLYLYRSSSSLWNWIYKHLTSWIYDGPRLKHFHQIWLFNPDIQTGLNSSHDLMILYIAEILHDVFQAVLLEKYTFSTYHF